MAETEVEIEKQKTSSELQTPFPSKPAIEPVAQKVPFDGLKEKMNQIMQMKPPHSKQAKEEI